MSIFIHIPRPKILLLKFLHFCVFFRAVFASFCLEGTFDPRGWREKSDWLEMAALLLDKSSTQMAKQPSTLAAIHVYSELPVSLMLIMSWDCVTGSRGTRSETDIKAPSGNNLVSLRQIYNILNVTIHPACCHPGRHVRHEGLKPSSQPCYC